MKKYLGLLFLALFFYAQTSFAHGGVSKNVDNSIVFLTQSPISPLLGEKVHFSFSLKDASYNAQAHKDIRLSVIDTAFNDEANDKIIFTQRLNTDVNGDFDFSYTFHKQNYFDIELTFLDPKTGSPETTGFLVQPRDNRGFLTTNIGLIISCLFLGFAAGRLIQRRTKNRAFQKNPATR